MAGLQLPRRDDDGKGDTWYADWKRHTARLGRPYLNRGVPFNFGRWDLPFLHWLARNGRSVDYLADADLETVASGRALAEAYDLIVFPGHHEYVTSHEYDVVEQFRDLGGNLMFLSANNFFRRVDRRGDQMVTDRRSGATWAVPSRSWSASSTAATTGARTEAPGSCVAPRPSRGCSPAQASGTE